MLLLLALSIICHVSAQMEVRPAMVYRHNDGHTAERGAIYAYKDLVFTGNQDLLVKVWSLANGTLLSNICDEQRWVTSLLIVDDHYLIMGSNGRLSIRKPDNPSTLLNVISPVLDGASVHGIAHQTNNIIWVWGPDKPFIEQYDFILGIRLYQLLVYIHGDQRGVTGLVFVSDTEFWTSGRNNGIKIFNAQTYQELQLIQLLPLSPTVWTIQLMLDGQVMYARSTGGGDTYWKMALNGTVLGQTSVGFNTGHVIISEGVLVFGPSTRASIIYHNLDTGIQVNQIPTSDVSQYVFHSSRPDVFLTAENIGTAFAARYLANGSVIWRTERNFGMLSVLATSDIVYSGSANGQLLRYDARSGHLVGNSTMTIGKSSSVLISDGNWLYVSIGGKMARASFSQAPLVDFCTHSTSGTINAAVIFNEFLITGGDDGSIKLWDVQSGVAIRQLPQEMYAPIMSMVVFGGRLLVSTVIQTGQWSLSSPLSPPSYINDCGFLGLQGQLLISGCRSILRIRNLFSDQVLFLYDIGETITALSSSPQCIYLGTHDGDILEYTFSMILNGIPTLRRRLTGNLNEVKALSVFGSMIYSAAADGSIRAWDIPVSITTLRRITTSKSEITSTSVTLTVGTTITKSDEQAGVHAESFPLAIALIVSMLSLVLMALVILSVYWWKKRQVITGELSRTRHTGVQNASRNKLVAVSLETLGEVEADIVSDQVQTTISGGKVSRISENVTVTSSAVMSDKATSSTFLGTTIREESPEISIPAFLQAQFGVDFSTGAYLTQGGGGVLYHATPLNDIFARRTQNHPIVAKIMADNIHGLSQRAYWGFYQELSLSYRFINHPNFVRIYGYSLEPVTLIMKFYRLGDLDSLIRNRGSAAKLYSYSRKLLCNVLRQLCGAVAHMHQIGAAHCDIKPQNVLLDSDEHRKLVVVLTDFGIARIFDASHVKVKAFMISDVKGASFSYAAPEVLLRIKIKMDEFDPRVWKAGDVYSLAITLCEMLRRRWPWK